jgi:hypothetical protein
MIDGFRSLDHMARISTRLGKPNFMHMSTNVSLRHAIFLGVRQKPDFEIGMLKHVQMGSVSLEEATMK